jgi:hypothetical protein
VHLYARLWLCECFDFRREEKGNDVSSGFAYRRSWFQEALRALSYRAEVVIRIKLFELLEAVAEFLEFGLALGESGFHGADDFRGSFAAESFVGEALGF